MKVKKKMLHVYNTHIIHEFTNYTNDIHKLVRGTPKL